MTDLEIDLDNRPGALADMGEALGRAGVSIEGGGVFVVGGRGVAHFLFADGEAARRALESAGIRVVAAREVLVQRLRQGETPANSASWRGAWPPPASTSRCSTAITIIS